MAVFQHIVNKTGRVTGRIVRRQVANFIWGRGFARMSKVSALRWLGIADGLWRGGAEQFHSANTFDDAFRDVFGCPDSSVAGVDLEKARADVKATLLKPKHRAFLARCQATCNCNELSGQPPNWDEYARGFKASVWTAVRALMAADGERTAGNGANDVDGECYADVFAIIEGKHDVWTAGPSRVGRRRFGKMIAPGRDGQMALARVDRGVATAKFRDVLDASIDVFCDALHFACSRVTDADLMRCSDGAVEPQLRRAAKKRRDANAAVGNSEMPPCIEEIYYPDPRKGLGHAKHGDRWRAAATFHRVVGAGMQIVYDEGRSKAAWSANRTSWLALHAETVKPNKKVYTAACSRIQLCFHGGDANACAATRGTAPPSAQTPAAVWSATASVAGSINSKRTKFNN